MGKMFCLLKNCSRHNATHFYVNILRIVSFHSVFINTFSDTQSIIISIYAHYICQEVIAINCHL